MSSASRLLLGIIGIFVAAGVLYFFSTARLREHPAALSPDLLVAATSTVHTLPPREFWDGKKKAPKTVAPATAFPIPDLNRPVTALIPLSQFAESDARKNIASLTEILKKNPDDFSAWVSLGVYRKVLGDYNGAEEVLTYVTRRWPTDFVAYNNLGNLYSEELRDFPKAEANFLKAADLRSSFVQSYVNLYELYRYSYKEKETQAPQALLRGLERNPTDFNLMLTLARYYAETGAKESSAMYYKMAIQWAETEKKAGLAESLRKEALESGVEL